MKTLRNTSIITLAVVTLALLVAAPVANAGTIGPYTATETGSTSSSVTYTVSVPLSSTDWNANLYIPQFNASLGTLTSVNINLSASGGTEIFGSALTDEPGVVSELYTGSTVVMTDPGVISTMGENLVGGAPNTGPSGFPPYGLVTPITISQSNSYDSTLLSMSGIADNNTYSSSLGAFIGGGDLTFAIDTDTNIYTASSGGNLDLYQLTSDQSTITVTYDYSGGPPVIPEPGTLTLFGTGLLGLAGMLRFKFMNSR
jgi:hypothetical protein